jgi:hypothetical protein
MIEPVSAGFCFLSVRAFAPIDAHQLMLRGPPFARESRDDAQV